MKNLIWALISLVIVIFVVFLFARTSGKNDTLIPGQKALESSSSAIIPKTEGTKTAEMNNLPFKLFSTEEMAIKKAKIKTAKGDITFQFFDDAPLATSNFITLADKKFFDGLTFHRREEAF